MIDFNTSSKRDRFLRKLHAKIKHTQAAFAAAPSSLTEDDLLCQPSPEITSTFGPIITEIMSIYREEEKEANCEGSKALPSLVHLSAWTLGRSIPCLPESTDMHTNDRPICLPWWLNRPILFQNAVSLLLESDIPGLPYALLHACLDAEASHQVMFIIKWYLDHLDSSSSTFTVMESEKNVYQYLYNCSLRFKKQISFIDHLMGLRSCFHIADPAYQSFLECEVGREHLSLLRNFIQSAERISPKECVRKKAFIYTRYLVYHGLNARVYNDVIWILRRFVSCAFSYFKWTEEQLFQLSLLFVHFKHSSRYWIENSDFHDLYFRLIYKMNRLNPCPGHLLNLMSESDTDLNDVDGIQWDPFGIELLWAVSQNQSETTISAKCYNILLYAADQDSLQSQEFFFLNVNFLIDRILSIGDSSFGEIALKNWEIEPVTDSWVMKNCYQGYRIATDSLFREISTGSEILSPIGTREEYSSDDSSSNRSRFSNPSFLAQSSDPLIDLRSTPTSPVYEIELDHISKPEFSVIPLGDKRKRTSTDVTIQSSSGDFDEIPEELTVNQGFCSPKNQYSSPNHDPILFDYFDAENKDPRVRRPATCSPSAETPALKRRLRHAKFNLVDNPSKPSSIRDDLFALKRMKNKPKRLIFNVGSLSSINSSGSSGIMTRSRSNQVGQSAGPRSFTSTFSLASCAIPSTSSASKTEYKGEEEEDDLVQ